MKTQIKNAAIFAATSLIGFAAALSHEWLAAVLCVGVTLLICYFFWIQRNPMALIIAAFFVSAGFVLLMLAPGSEGKIELYRSAYGTESFMTFKEIFALPLGKFFTKIYQTFNFLAQNDMLFCCVAILILFWASKMLFFRAFGWRHWLLLPLIFAGVWLDEVCLMMVVGATLLLADVWRVCGWRSVERLVFVWVAWLFMGLCLIQLEGTPLRARFLDTTLLVAMVAMMWRDMVGDFAARAEDFGAGAGGAVAGYEKGKIGGVIDMIFGENDGGAGANVGGGGSGGIGGAVAGGSTNSNLNLAQNGASFSENLGANSANPSANPSANSANSAQNLTPNAAYFSLNSAQNAATLGANSPAISTPPASDFNANASARLLPFAAKFEFALKFGAILAFIVGTLYATANSYANGILQLKLNALIQASARAGQADVVVPRTLSLPAGLGRFCDWAVLGDDPATFPNDVYARFYGVKSVQVK